MFSFITINLVSANYGPQVSGVVLTGPGASAEPYRDGRVVPSDLPVPWRELQPEPDVFSLLQWCTRISEFDGRDAEMKALRGWANSGSPISAKFVTGEGGVGKTRLAAELAKELRKKGWAAGFPNLREPKGYFAKNKGTLLIVDYPEEHPGGLEAFFAGLAQLEEDQCSRLRVLFLSRREADEWRQLALDSNADAMFDWKPIHLGPLKGEAAYTVFHSAFEKAMEAKETVAPPVSMEALDAWLEQAPENDRALFIVAAGVQCALNPDSPIVDYKGRDVVAGLVERETTRLRRVAKGLGLPRDSLSRLLAFAAICDGLSGEAMERLAAKKLRLGLPRPAGIVEKLEEAGWLVDGGIPAPKPDILAAALLVTVLSRASKEAPEWLWAGIEDDVSADLERLGRLSHDAEIVLGLHKHRLSDWLETAFKGKSERCARAQEFVADAWLPVGLVPMEVTVWETLAKAASDEAKKAYLLNNLSIARSKIGDGAGALTAIREAVKIYRRLAAANPARFEPNLAMSLNTLSNRLSEAGDHKGALAAIREAVKIYRRLAAANPARFEPELATSLNTLSNRLSEAGDGAGALAASQKAVDINRRLAAANSARFEPTLALSLNNLSHCLSAAGDGAGALAAIREAVDIHRRLAAANPARFEPDLAMSLNNLSNCLSVAGDGAGALAAIREAVDIRRRLAAANPARFEPNLALSLNNLSNCLSKIGDGAGALAAIREAVKIYRRLAKANPARFEPDLAMSLGALGTILRQAGKAAEAASALREGIALVKPYAEKYPDGPAGRLLKTLERVLFLVEGPEGGVGQGS